MDHEQQDKPSFFAIIKEGFNTKCMKVPPKIVMDLGEEFWKKASIILVCSSGEKWEVKILKKANDIYVRNFGWQKFLKDNSVGLEEFLVFTYIGENLFNVEIYGKNGLEKPCFKKKQEVVAAPIVAKRKRGRPRRNPAGVEEEKEEAAPTIVAKTKMVQRKYPSRVCVRKEKAETLATIVTKKGIPRKNPAPLSVILVD
ncbi:putative transcription factor B3-Domain family [Medicago truncatula]|uniref:B3 DNA-binding domain protein n=1 Tax=Medicago truncatula TaxID=3880 RepID=G7JEY0_MEDTR|nr:B3 domain-containing protein At3g17010 [Medicago truncatula]XP_024637208.1 B3 domain-containing protein At3g17010 [Medicago truncatula]XP_039688894.1 B3 domain-containing protein At3g17010 [Medicago truncatula]AES89038.1 B3 DNA-binding domain protein [Medicago truncatula]RHN61192.1 putative transcription factor B3-Domain family [Medicago truncatula]